GAVHDHLSEPPDLGLSPISPVRAAALPDLAQSGSAGLQLHRRHRGGARSAPRAMRDSVADPLVEEHHATDRRSSRDGLPCGGGDPVFRRMALGAPPTCLRQPYALPQRFWTRPTKRAPRRRPPFASWESCLLDL